MSVRKSNEYVRHSLADVTHPEQKFCWRARGFVQARTLTLGTFQAPQHHLVLELASDTRLFLEKNAGCFMNECLALDHARPRRVPSRFFIAYKHLITVLLKHT